MISGALVRVQAGRDQRRMTLVETLNLGGKRQLMLVLCDGQAYLIGTGGDSVHSIQAVATPAGGADIDDGPCPGRGEEVAQARAGRLH